MARLSRRYMFRKYRLFTVGIPDCLIVVGWSCGSIWCLVMRINIQDQPTFRRASRPVARPQGTDPGALIDHQCGEPAIALRLRDVSLHVRAQAVQSDGAHFNARDIRRHRRQDGVHRELSLSFEFSGPKGVEIGRSRNGWLQPIGSDSRADAGIRLLCAASPEGLLALRRHPHVDHRWIVDNDLDRGRA